MPLATDRPKAYWSDHLFRRTPHYQVKPGDLVWTKAAAYPSVVSGPYRVRSVGWEGLIVDLVYYPQSGGFKLAAGPVFVPKYRPV